jgi:hypothetical protein
VTQTSIFACRDARGPQWQLGPLPPPTGRLTLVGWSQTPAPRDGGVPEDVARVLARAFTSTARVTFPCSFVNTGAAASVWSPLDGDHVRALTGKGIGKRIVAKVKHAPPDITLMSTRRAQTAMRLFDDAGFAWWLQGQVVVLSAPAAPPPDVNQAELLSLFDEDWARRAASLAGLDVHGVVRPGVDGDVAGLLSLTQPFSERVLGALEHEARTEGFEWDVVSEEAFVQRT